jgi:hypothetical protein
VAGENALGGMMENIYNLKNVKCSHCKNILGKASFYSKIFRKLNEKTNEYEFTYICKDFLKKEFEMFLNNKKDITEAMKCMCRKYDIYYNIEVLSNIISNNDINVYIFGKYIKEINSLKQYEDKKYKDSINENIIIKKVLTDDKSDIDFINDDIKGLKHNIQNALYNKDFNAHNKWMNSLRDAIELRDKLQGNSNNVFNITVNEMKAVDFENIIESIKSAQNRCN